MTWMSGFGVGFMVLGQAAAPWPWGMLSAFIAAGLGGLVLLVWAWRGRRLDDHPICRRCHYDLSGCPAGAASCPECGTELDKKRAVRIGTRRRRKNWVIAALLLVLVSGGLIGVWGWGRAREVDWNEYKPVWLLVWEIENRSGQPAEDAETELVNRVTEGIVGYDDISSHVDRVLTAMLAEVDPASVGYRAIMARIDSGRYGVMPSRFLAQYAPPPDMADDPRWHEFARRGHMLDFKLRENLEIGDRLPLRVWGYNTIGSRLFGYSISRRTVTLRQGNRSWKLSKNIESKGNYNWYDTGTLMPGAPHPINHIRCNLLPLEGDDWTPPLSSDELEPGLLELDFSYTVTAVHTKTRTKLLTFTHTESQVVLLTAPGEDVVSPVTDEARKPVVHIYQLDARTLDGRPNIMLIARVDQLSVALAADIFVQDGSQRWKLGQLLGLSGNSIEWADYSAIHDDFNAEGPVEIVLVPDPDLARSTVDTTEIWGEEIVIPNVPVEWRGR